MIRIILMLVIGMAFISLFIVSIDLCAGIMWRLRRYHIGRWESQMQWEAAVQNRAIKWLNHMPTIQKTDNNRYIFFNAVLGKRRDEAIQSWQTASLVLGLNGIKNQDSITSLKKWKNRVIDKTGSWTMPITKIDFAFLGYAMMRISSDIEYIYPAMKQIAQVIENNICKDGIVSYSQGTESSIRFVDTLGMVCPFLICYGVKYNKNKYIDIAINQLEFYHENGLMCGTNLPCHAIHADTKMPLGVYGWGRGTAWYCLALLDSWKELQTRSQREKIEKWLRNAAEEYYSYQSEDGGFQTILQGGGQYDSSVTAAMCYFYKACYCIFDEPKYLEVSERGLNRLRRVTMMDGAIDLCQGDTHGIGCFSQVFDIMPFAQGLVLRTLFIDIERE